MSRHFGLLVYLIAAWSLVDWPWGFWLCVLGIWWARRSPDWLTKIRDW